MNAAEYTAVGVFDTWEEATPAVEALRHAGFTDEQIGIASQNVTRHFANVSATQQHTAEGGAIKGSIIGGGIGALLGIAGATLVPGGAPIVAGGLLLSLLMGGAAGAAAGAFAGPFIALGMSESDAQEHARFVEQGKTVLLVYSPDRHDLASRIMVQQGAYDDSMSSSS